ncbi:50S ribosomal protein L32 [Candidatus Cytomitobacter indipagum]|uniref:Large ribosomal subunit protein bL32 n=1 Tax=Candidatus Cytomitobacter indipagum TaxID=2601575 RepID=A0A5C0UD09_9PROT|nr:50S ribosomal protein L32 [Candidatus Cytomitobacter indipagum]QEK37916.1 50S ribosomal protein L32 [Candidatus Cytomitobacter indipagum]
MAVPKKRVSIQKRRLRHSNSRIRLPNTVVCSCGKYRLTHNACKHCGMYRGRQIIKIKTED